MLTQVDDGLTQAMADLRAFYDGRTAKIITLQRRGGPQYRWAWVTRGGDDAEAMSADEVATMQRLLRALLEVSA